MYISFPVNESLQKVTDNLTNYVKYESWRYCKICHIVEPNKMLPTYGKQKLNHITNCKCTKGRYFVPMVCTYLFYFSIHTYISIYLSIYLSIYIYTYIYLYILYIYNTDQSYRYLYVYIYTYYNIQIQGSI